MLQSALLALDRAASENPLRDWSNGGQIILEYLKATTSKAVERPNRDSLEQLAERLSRWTVDLAAANQAQRVPFRHRNWDSDLALERATSAAMSATVSRLVHLASDQLSSQKVRSTKPLDEAARLASLAVPDEHRTDLLHKLAGDYLRWRVGAQ